MSKKTEYKQKNEQYMLDLQNKEGIHKFAEPIAPCSDQRDDGWFWVFEKNLQSSFLYNKKS